jgi:hypothetical protein
MTVEGTHRRAVFFVSSPFVVLRISSGYPGVLRVR